MRTLYLLRHAKSDWSGRGAADYDRPLNKRGQQAAPRMGKFMAVKGLFPQRILCSAANRTRQTLAGIEPFIGRGADIQIMERIYSGGALEYFNLLRSQNDDAGTVMLIGHNPWIQGLAMALTGSGGADTRRRLARKYPTAGLCVLTFEIDSWSEIKEGSGHLDMFVTPKRLA